MRDIIIDIETDGLDITGNIHCIGVKVIDNNIPDTTKCYTSHYVEGSDGTLDDFIELIKTADRIVHFNGLAFDIPFMSEYFQVNFNCKHLDLLILSKIMFTSEELYSMDIGINNMPKSLYGMYSLEAFGYRLGTTLKGEHSDWTQLTKEMVAYCKQDIEVTYTLYKQLLSMDNLPLDSVLELEQQVKSIMTEQERFGFYFDINKARDLSTKYLLEKMTIEKSLSKTFRPKFLPDGQIKRSDKVIKQKIYYPNNKYKMSYVYRWRIPLKRYKSGKIRLPAKNAFKWFTSPMRTVIQEKYGEYQDIKYTKFKATDNQIKIWLKDMYGFEFDTYTEKGNIKVDRDKLLKLGKDGEDLRRLIKLKKDLSQLSGTDNSLIAQYNSNTHCIHGKTDTLGAATHRVTHYAPNLAQIPSSKEFRELFTVPEGWKFVGADLANIELRMLAHYLAEHGNKEYATLVATKDMHWEHAKLVFWNGNDEYDEHNVEMKKARTKAKTFIFSWLYGSGDTVRGDSLWSDGCLDDYTQEEYKEAKKRVESRLTSNGLFPLKKDTYIKYDESLILKTIYGKRISDLFLSRVKGLPELIDHVQKQSKEIGKVMAIDGRYLYSRSPHSALNLLLQGSASIIAKKWMVNYHNLAKDKGLIHGIHYVQQAYIHDEYDCRCMQEYSDILAYCLEEGANKVTYDFNTNIPIKAEAMIGNNWYECH